MMPTNQLGCEANGPLNNEKVIVMLVHARGGPLRSGHFNLWNTANARFSEKVPVILFVFL